MNSHSAWTAARVRPPRTLGEIAQRCRPFDPETPCAQIDAWFREDVRRAAAVVRVDEGHAAISRTRFHQAMSGPKGYGWALFHAKPIIRLLDEGVPSFSADQMASAIAVETLGLSGDAYVVRFDDGSVGSVSSAAIFAELAAEHRDNADAFERAHRRFRALADSVSDIVVVLGADGRIAYVNPSASSMVETSTDQLIGRRFVEVLHDDDQAAAEGALATCLALPTRHGDAEVRLRSTDGSWRYFALRARNLLGDVDVGGLVVSMTDTTERYELAAALHHQAFHDALTGLPNRALFMDRLHQAMLRSQRSPGRVAVLFIDLDGFKDFNDTLGHGGGDRVLVACADRFASVLRAGVTLSRFGGDEFVVLIEEATDPGTPRVVAERLRVSLSAPIAIGDRAVQVRCSVGTARQESAECTPEELLRRADVALYEAKAGGRDCVRVWVPDLQQSVSRVRELRTDLAHAIDRQEIWVAYQPLCDMRSGDIVGLEALARWSHPTLGPVSPAEFIAIAEENDVIHELGAFVLERACADAALLEPLMLSVNVSALQLRLGLAASVASILERTGFPAHRLELEITESAVAQTPELFEVLVELKRLGVRLAVDDFGTGYSSLAQLRRFPIDTVKLDRSFLDASGAAEVDAVLIEGIVRLAHSLDLQVTAEGIETAAQLDMLRQLRCDRAQGFHLGRPVSLGDLHRALADRPASIAVAHEA